MKVKEEDVDAIFETIIDSRDPYTQAQLLISLQALAKVLRIITELFIICDFCSIFALSVD